MNIFYEAVTLEDGTIYNDNRGWQIQRRGDTIILVHTAWMDSTRTLHIPWVRVREAVVGKGSDPQCGIVEGETAAAVRTPSDTPKNAFESPKRIPHSPYPTTKY